MVKVFSLNKTIYLIDNKNLYKPGSKSTLEPIASEAEMRKKYEALFRQQDIDEAYFLNDKLENLLTFFSSMFKIIEAAGGLVQNNEGKWLFIFRNGKWDLPKGKIEKGEKVKTAAIREVEEECGISKLQIIKELPSTYHTYFMEEKQVLKRTYWFEMSCADTSALVPQIEEGITDVQWLAPTEFKKVKTNTYESILDVLKALE
ncbi:MAG: NUDIX domain-containing protein [Bacteroidia bacterium]|nr:NUDIX domain-containing protein [Bacteroidia bacterium]